MKFSLKFSLKLSRIKKYDKKGKKYENKLYHNSWGSTNCISNLLSFGLSQNIKWHQIRLDSIYTSNFIFLVQIEHFLEHLRITWYRFCHISRSWSPKKPIWNLNLINSNWLWGGIHFKIGSLITKKHLIILKFSCSSLELESLRVLISVSDLSSAGYCSAGRHTITQRASNREKLKIGN